MFALALIARLLAAGGRATFAAAAAAVAVAD